MEKFIEKLVEMAHAEGISNLQFVFETTEKHVATAFDSRVWESQISDVTTVRIEGCVNGMVANTTAECFEEEMIPELISNLKQSAEYSKDEFVPLILTQTAHGETEKLFSLKQMGEVLLAAEKAAVEKRDGIAKFQESHAAECIRTIRIQNEEGVYMQDRSKFADYRIQARAQKGETVQVASKVGAGKSFGDIDFIEMYEELAENAVHMLDADPVVTGAYPVVLKSSVLCEMLSMYAANFGANQIHSKLSKMTGMLGQQVAAPFVNLIEDPQHPWGVNNRSFDDEGTPTQKKMVIRDGVLQQYLYNRREAAKDGLCSTGNGFKASPQEKTQIGVTNLILEGQENSLDDLLEIMGDGLYITHCDGMFAGANVTTGGFALISKGFLVEKGKKVKGVNQITIAGNFYDMLKQVMALGNDYQISKTPGGAFIVPSAYVGELVISGK